MDSLTIVLAVLKAVGLLTAGVFGIVGAVTNFRDDSGKLTRWGRRNLIALIMGLVLSLSAQMVEYVRGRSEATAAAERARKAADQAEQLLLNTADATKKIAKIDAETERIAEEAVHAADRLSEVGSDVQRSLDPMEPLEISARFLIPLPDSVGSATETYEVRGLRELIAFRSKLDSIKVPINPDDESGPSVDICESCETYPSESSSMAHMLLTESYEVYFGFLKRDAQGKFPSPDRAEPEMAFWISSPPQIAKSPDDDPSTLYFPGNGMISTSLKSQVVPPDSIFSPRSVRSVDDFLDRRMYIEVRTFAGGWLPSGVLRGIRPSLIEFDLPGRRELQFTNQNLKRFDGKTATYWIFDFPKSRNELKKLYAP